MPDPTIYPRMRLRLIAAGGAWLGPGKAELLEGIAATGSIAAAGRRMGMSYKRAWGLVETLNGMFTGPLVVTSRGGAGQGGAEVTALGREVLARYQAIVAKAAAAAAEDCAALGALMRAGQGLQ